MVVFFKKQNNKNNNVLNSKLRVRDDTTYLSTAGTTSRAHARILARLSAAEAGDVGPR